MYIEKQFENGSVYKASVLLLCCAFQIQYHLPSLNIQQDKPAVLHRFTMLPSLLVAPLLAVVALAAPSPDLEDRAVKSCTLKTTTALKYRKCASTSCTAVGQYAKGAKVKVSCVKAGQSVKGDT